uniref:Selenoprotein H n=1 Tax=Monodelphis domestica TaxID=13616 RepID=A0A5F8HLQ7_MONDO
MAPRGRKRKADVAAAALTEKPEKLAQGGEEGAGEARVVIEHCQSRVYARHAEAVGQALRLARPGLPVLLNPAKPRRSSFEVTLLRPDGSRVELWSGIKKGPPRKLKFPEPAQVVEELKARLV